MNTGLIKNTKTIQQWVLPHTAKSNRVVTKHYTNLVMFMDRDKLALFSWLIYHCGIDNKIKYSTKLLNQYIGSVKAVEEYFDVETELTYSIQIVRLHFKKLIEDGFILSFGDELVLNPMYSYQADYITAKGYKLLCEGSQETIGIRYVQMVNEKVYGKAYKHKGSKKA